MAGQVLGPNTAPIGPGFDLQPSSHQTPLASNYITDFNFLNQYLPDTYEKEFERYGNRTISSFIRMVGAEMPSNSDLIKWSEQGRLHTKYVNVGCNPQIGAGEVVFQVNDVINPAGSTVQPGSGATAQIAIRVGQTIVVSDNAGINSESKAIVIAVDLANNQFTAAFYSSQGFSGGTVPSASDVSVFIYGSEFKKGTNGMQGSLESDSFIFENSPIIIKDKYAVSGSDMAQIGWIEVTTENGASGYLWYLKSEHETRLRYDDYLETSMIEAVPAEAASGVNMQMINDQVGNKGSEGVFYVVQNRGNVWAGGNPNALVDFDAIISRLDAPTK